MTDQELQGKVKGYMLNVNKFIMDYCLRDGLQPRDIARKMSNNMGEYVHNLNILVELGAHEFWSGKEYLPFSDKFLKQLSKALNVPDYILKAIDDKFACVRVSEKKGEFSNDRT